MPTRFRRISDRIIEENRLLTRNRRTVGKMFTNYTKLHPKIDKICRLKEAKSLLKMAERWGNNKQREATARLLKSQNRLGIFLQCRCDDADCDWANYDEREERAYCECYLGDALCHGVFVTTLEEMETD